MSAAKNPKLDFPKKNQTKNNLFQGFYADVISSKRQKQVMLPLPLKLKNPNFGTEKTNFSKQFLTNFQSPCCCNFIQKVLKNHKLIFHKPSFGTHQKTQKKSFSQKGFCSVLNLYAVTTSCKKTTKMHALTFDNI